MNKLKQGIDSEELLIISRPLWWIFTAQPFFLIYVILSDAVDLRVIIGTLFLLFPYNLAMYGINDIFDYESDIRNPRKTSVLPKSKHQSLWMWIGLINVPFIGYLFYTGNLQSNLWFGLMLFMVVAYSLNGLRFKEIPLLDSVTSSFHYTSPVMLALLLTNDAATYAPAFIAYFLWAMANHAFGAIQDIKPDREASIKSIATQLEAKRTTSFVLTLYIGAAVISAWFYGMVGLVAAGLICMNIIGVARTVKHTADSTNPIFRNMWNVFIKTNYLAGMIMTIVLIVVKARL